MKIVVAAFAAACLIGGSAFAQEPAQPAPQAAPAPHQSAKELRKQCRSDAQGQGLKGAALKSAVKDCVAKADPAAAAAMACKEQGKSQNLTGKELKAFVRKCKVEGGAGAPQGAAPQAAPQ